MGDLVYEMLTVICYGLDVLTRPGRYAYGAGDAKWMETEGAARRLRYLRAQGLVRRERDASGWVYALTEAGRDRVAGAREPLARWQRPWDGWWRQVVFDLPMEPKHREKRGRVLRWLRRQGFGYLQDSVWIRPDPVTEIAEQLEGFRNDAGAFTLLESRCAHGFSDASLVRAAWPFDIMRRRYQAYRDLATAALSQLNEGKVRPQDGRRLMRQERKCWLAAFQFDPLLPRALWPPEYDGHSAWRIRQVVLRRLAECMTCQ